MEDETGGGVKDRERGSERDMDGTDIDSGIGAWFTGGTHVWPIDGESEAKG